MHHGPRKGWCNGIHRPRGSTDPSAERATSGSDRPEFVLNLADVKRRKAMQEPMGLTLVFGHWGLLLWLVPGLAARYSDKEQRRQQWLPWQAGRPASRASFPVEPRISQVAQKANAEQPHFMDALCPFPLQCDQGLPPPAVGPLPRVPANALAGDAGSRHRIRAWGELPPPRGPTAGGCCPLAARPATALRPFAVGLGHRL